MFLQKFWRLQADKTATKKWHLWCTIKTADDNKLNNGLRKKSLKAAQSSKYEATVRSSKLAKKIELSLQSRE